jgi:hypothetical protein
MCALNYNGNMYVFAGRNATDACNDVWICTGREMAWKQLAAHAPFPPTEQAGCASFDGGMFLIGGLSDHVAMNQVWASYDGSSWDNNSNPLEEIWVTTTGKSWTQVQSIEPRAVHVG